MPLYTYRCDHCGVQFERRQHFDDPPLRTCPECGKRALRKLFLPVGIVFKGSGFYSTDHRRSSGLSSAPNDKPEAAEKKPEAGKKTERKAEQSKAPAED